MTEGGGAVTGEETIRRNASEYPRARRGPDGPHPGFTPLDDIGPLDDLPALEDLGLRATPVATVEPLHGRDRLARLDIAHTRVRDLPPLHGRPALRVVEVEGAPVTPDQVAALVAAHDGAVEVRG